MYNMAKERNSRSRNSSSPSNSTKITSKRTHGKTALVVKSPKKTKKSARKAKLTMSKKRAAKTDAMKLKKPPIAFFYFLEDFRKEYRSRIQTSSQRVILGNHVDRSGKQWHMRNF